MGHLQINQQGNPQNFHVGTLAPYEVRHVKVTLPLCKILYPGDQLTVTLWNCREYDLDQQVMALQVENNLPIQILERYQQLAELFEEQLVEKHGQVLEFLKRKSSQMGKEALINAFVDRFC